MILYRPLLASVAALATTTAVLAQDAATGDDAQAVSPETEQTEALDPNAPAITEDTETEMVETEPVIEGDATTDTADAAGGLYGTFADHAVTDLVGLNVLARAGEETELRDIGEVEKLIRTATSDDVMAVVGVGGFLGIGEHDVAVPLARFQEGEDGLVLPEITREQLEALAPYEEVEGDETLPLDTTVAGEVIVPEEPAVDATGQPAIVDEGAAGDAQSN